MNRDVGGPRPPVSRGRAAAVGLVIVAAVSPQLGAAFAVTLFDELGPAGAAFLRLAFAAIVLWAIWRPRLTGDLRLAGAFGVALGLMNWSFYEAIDRIPLAVAVTIEFAGPLLVAVIGSRRPLDGVWIVLAAAGIVVLVDPGGGSLDPAGVSFALAAAACWMAYIYLSKRTGAAFPGGSGLAIAMDGRGDRPAGAPGHPSRPAPRVRVGLRLRGRLGTHPDRDGGRDRPLGLRAQRAGHRRRAARRGVRGRRAPAVPGRLPGRPRRSAGGGDPGQPGGGRGHRTVTAGRTPPGRRVGHPPRTGRGGTLGVGGWCC